MGAPRPGAVRAGLDLQCADANPRSELPAAALRGTIYVAGGTAQLGTTTAFEAYDPALDSWEELLDLPAARHQRWWLWWWWWWW